MRNPGHPPRKRAPVSATERVHLRTAWLAEREREAEQREALADDREALANERESRADLRAGRLAEREREADQREALADNREALANERESHANLRDKRLAEREESLDDLRRGLARTIEHTRALLAADQRHRDPPQAVAADLADYAQGGQVEAADRKRLTATLTRLRQQVEQSQALRSQTAAVISALAAMEERIARQHDDMAAVSARNADKYRRFAADARAAAERARAILRNQR